MKLLSVTSVPGISLTNKLPGLPWFRGEKLGQRLFRTRAMDELPRMITHERIYILPSRRGWAFVLSLFIMLVASINYSLSLGFVLCFMLTGLFASTLIATYKNLAGLLIKKIGSTEGVAGTRLQIPVTAYSHHKPRFGIRVENSTGSVCADIEPDTDSTLWFPQEAVRRGFQNLGRMTISSDYPLGLWFTWSYLHVENQSLVFPKPEANAPVLPANNADSHHGNQTANVGEFAGLREYRPGDQISHIAWKTAAKGMGLNVREYTSNVSTDLKLNWNQTHQLKDMEARISRLAAWVQKVRQSNGRASLSLPAIQVPAGQGEKHYREVMKALALFDHADSRH